MDRLSLPDIVIYGRLFIIIAFGVIQLFLALPSAFYPQIIGVLDLVFGSGMQVLGSMLVVVGIWWGTKTGYYRQLLFADPESNRAYAAQLWFRWAIPGTLLLVLLGYLYENFV
jgi:NSS family neurotransmitter:Na+ symporter